MGAQGVEFRLLGPLEVERDGRVLPVGGRRQRALLTFLLLHANTVVARDRLIDALWGEDPPETAENALQGAGAAGGRTNRHAWAGLPTPGRSRGARSPAFHGVRRARAGQASRRCRRT